MTTSTRRVFAVVNPNAHHASQAVSLLQQGLEARGEAPAVVLDSTPDTMGAPQARRALESGATLVVAGGGDGTVAAVAQELRGTDVPLAVLPLGTANIYARNLGLQPRRVQRAVDTALDGTASRLDLGLASWRTEDDPDNWSAEHLFFVLAGLGRDAETVAALDPRIKDRLGWLAYFVAGAPRMRSRPLPLQVRVDDAEPQRREVWSYLVGNARRIPTGMELFPGAELDDGLLRTLEVRVARPWQWLRVAGGGLLRWRAESAHLVHGTARHVELVPDTPCLLQLDGDVHGPVVALRLRTDRQSLLVTLPNHEETR